MTKASRSVLFALALFGSATAHAQPPRAGARGATPTIEDKTGPMRKLDGYLPMFWDEAEGRLYLEVKQLGAELLHSNGFAAGLGSNDIGLDRGALAGSRIVFFERVGPKLLLVQPNYEFRAVSQNPAEIKAVKDAFARSEFLLELSFSPLMVPFWQTALSFKGNTAKSMNDAALLLTQRPLQRHVGRRLFIVVGLFGVAAIVFGLSHDYWLSFAALLVLGAADMVSVYIRGTLVPLATPDELRGRVTAVESVFIGASNELGMFVAGTGGALLGPVMAVVVGGSMTLVVTLSWASLFPALRRLDRFTELT